MGRLRAGIYGWTTPFSLSFFTLHLPRSLRFFKLLLKTSPRYNSVWLGFCLVLFKLFWYSLRILLPPFAVPLSYSFESAAVIVSTANLKFRWSLADDKFFFKYKIHFVDIRGFPFGPISLVG